MLPAKGYAVQHNKDKLAPFSFERRELNEDDVLIDIKYCGVCHSDIHQVRDEWGNSIYPMVPGHEIVGVVNRVGDKVTRFKPGDIVGVGCLVDSCQSCGSCDEGLEQYCEKGFVLTYNGYEKDGKTITYGGYADIIVCKEDFVLRVPDNLDLAAAAPLLCAGITTYSPLKFFKAGPNKKVGVIGLGGLGHMALKFSKAMGCDTTLFTHSPSKQEAGLALGANQVVLTHDESNFADVAGSFDLIINTVSADIDYAPYINCLKREGTLVLLGVPEQPISLHPSALIFQRKMIAGSLIGGIKETQEMLDFCSEHGITSDIEMININQINEAYERMLDSDVKYRFVIDTATI